MCYYYFVCSFITLRVADDFRLEAKSCKIEVGMREGKRKNKEMGKE